MKTRLAKTSALWRVGSNPIPRTIFAVSLWVSACIDGTLHGVPKSLCHEFQVQHFDSIEACEKARPIVTAYEFLKSLERFNIPARLAGGPLRPG